jgi:hypothetical protein
MSRVVVDPSDSDRPCRVEPLSYLGAPFHRMKLNVGVQGGDIINKDGSGEGRAVDSGMSAGQGAMFC